MRPVILLGPQRLRPTVGAAMRAFKIQGPVATVTAGWEEREDEEEELVAALGRDTWNLRLYARAEEVFERDPQVLKGLRRRHDRLREQQRLYRLQLDHSLSAARDLLGRKGEREFLEPARTFAIDAVRRLDAENIYRKRDIKAAFDATWRFHQHPEVVRHHQELGDIMGQVQALVITGGHVGALLNRLWLFQVPALAAHLPIVAWSAGAMCLSERLILFHDSPPQGPGNAEVFEEGFGLVRDIVPLPHAHRRLRLEDATRVSLFSRRFAPSISVAMPDGSRLAWTGERWSASRDARRLTPEGGLRALAGSPTLARLPAPLETSTAPREVG